jgi:hypothetical protein
MAKTNSNSLQPSKAASEKRRVDSDGNIVSNKILLNLSRDEFDQVLSKLELVRLKLH